jgi:hypothetical protein
MKTNLTDLRNTARDSLNNFAKRARVLSSNRKNWNRVYDSTYDNYTIEQAFKYHKRILTQVVPFKQLVHALNKKGGKAIKTFMSSAVEQSDFIAFRPSVSLVNNKKAYVKVLSVDIDTTDDYLDFRDLDARCVELGLPLPTFKVETARGWHLHWFLDFSFNLFNQEDTLIRKELTNKLNMVFNGDTQAVGYFYRNPLRHNYEFHNKFAKLEDFSAIFKFESYKKKRYRHIKKAEEKELIYTKKEAILEDVKKSANISLTDDIDLTKIQEGGRNQALYQKLRTYGLLNYLSIDEQTFMNKALQFNELLPSPLMEVEVKNTARSVWGFVRNNFKVLEDTDTRTNRDYANKHKIPYIKKLKSISRIVQAFLDLFVFDEIPLDALYNNRYYDRSKDNHYITNTKLAEMTGLCLKTISERRDEAVKLTGFIISLFLTEEGYVTTAKDIEEVGQVKNGKLCVPVTYKNYVSLFNFDLELNPYFNTLHLYYRQRTKYFYTTLDLDSKDFRRLPEEKTYKEEIELITVDNWSREIIEFYIHKSGNTLGFDYLNPNQDNAIANIYFKGNCVMDYTQIKNIGRV